MPQPMTTAPSAQAGWDKTKEQARRIAQVMAGMVSPTAGSPLAAGVAGIRSLLPGGGSFRQEMEAYNLGAKDPGESVTDQFQAPGEDPWAAMRRWAASPGAQREVMQGASLVGPIAVHASPVKWRGQPSRAHAGTGEGGAAYGEGLYATVPSNAKGIDQRYRADAAELLRPVVRLDGFDLDTMAMNPIVKERLIGEFPKQVAYGSKIDAEGALMMARVKLEDKVRFADREAARFQAMGATDAAGEYLNLASDYRDALADLSKLTPDRFSVPGGGSFHVWDVPDRLMDWDKTVGEQSEAAINALRNAYSRRYGAEQSRAFLDGPAKSMSVGKFLEALGSGDASVASGVASRAGIQGHTYRGEAGSALTSGLEGDVPNFVIYDDAAVKPLGTFGSADEFLASDLYKALKPRIDAEEALRKSGQTTPEAYAAIRKQFADALIQAMGR